MSAIQQVIKHKDAVYNYVDGGPIKGYTKRGGIPDGEPWIGWYGNKMPHSLWVQILAFFAWSYDTHKSEALVHLYYNEATGNWIVWAPPQRGIGMTVKTEDNHVNWKQAEEFVGYVKVGTGHHHCATKAFQSGTDHADECTGNGIHFTVGDMDKDFHDLHARAVFNGNMIETSLNEWVDMAPKYAAIPNLPRELLSTAYEYSLRSCAPEGAEFPQQWKDNFSSSYYSGNNSSSWQGQGHGHTSMGFHNQNRGVSSMNGVVTVDGVQGYWGTVNGEQKFIPFKHQPEKKIIIPAAEGAQSKTPSELGAEKIEALLRGGLTWLKLEKIQDDLRTTNRANWTGDKYTLAVIEILNKHGLNPAWLEKLMREIELAEVGQSDDYMRQGSWMGGA